MHCFDESRVLPIFSLEGCLTRKSRSFRGRNKAVTSFKPLLFHDTLFQPECPVYNVWKGYILYLKDPSCLPKKGRQLTKDIMSTSEVLFGVKAMVRSFVSPKRAFFTGRKIINYKKKILPYVGQKKCWENRKILKKCTISSGCLSFLTFCTQTSSERERSMDAEVMRKKSTNNEV